MSSQDGPFMSPASTGRPLGARFSLGPVIGSGSLGRVYRAEVVNGGQAAVKLLRPDLAADPRLVAAMLGGRDQLRSVTNPHIVQVLDVIAESGNLAIVTQLVTGADLCHEFQGAVEVPLALNVMSQAADGLVAIHSAGLVHRDLKPSNILCQLDTDNHYRIRLTDFGLGSLVASVAASGVVGTPGYLAPEVAAGRPATAAADVYALGVVLYELIAGRPPFEADSPLGLMLAHSHERPTRPEGISDDLWALMERLLAKDPDLRPTAEDAGTRFRFLRSASVKAARDRNVVEPYPSPTSSGWIGQAISAQGAARASSLAPAARAGAVATGAALVGASAAAVAGGSARPSSPHLNAPSRADTDVIDLTEAAQIDADQTMPAGVPVTAPSNLQSNRVPAAALGVADLFDQRPMSDLFEPQTDRTPVLTSVVVPLGAAGAAVAVSPPAAAPAAAPAAPAESDVWASPDRLGAPMPEAEVAPPAPVGLGSAQAFESQPPLGLPGGLRSVGPAAGAAPLALSVLPGPRNAMRTLAGVGAVVAVAAVGALAFTQLNKGTPTATTKQPSASASSSLAVTTPAAQPSASSVPSGTSPAAPARASLIVTNVTATTATLKLSEVKPGVGSIKSLTVKGATAAAPVLLQPGVYKVALTGLTSATAVGPVSVTVCNTAELCTESAPVTFTTPTAGAAPNPGTLMVNTPVTQNAAQLVLTGVSANSGSIASIDLVGVPGSVSADVGTGTAKVYPLSVTGLSPSTTYQVSAKVCNTSRRCAKTPTVALTTSGPTQVAPSVAVLTAPTIGSSSVRLKATGVDPGSSALKSVSFYLDQTPQAGTPGDAAGTYVADVTGLTPGSAHTAQVGVCNADGLCTRSNLISLVLEPDPIDPGTVSVSQLSGKLLDVTWTKATGPAGMTCTMTVFASPESPGLGLQTQDVGVGDGNASLLTIPGESYTAARRCTAGGVTRTARSSRLTAQ